MGVRLRFAMPAALAGDVVRVRRRDEPLACEVVGFDGGAATPLASPAGVGPDDGAEATGVRWPFVPEPCSWDESSTG